MHTQVGHKRALDLPSLLAYAYAPIIPYLKKIKVRREPWLRG